MAYPTVRVKKIILKFIETLQKHIPVEKVYLYGSNARGDAGMYSDIDLAIVSRDFAKQAPFDRLVFLGKIAWEAGTPVVEAIGYTPKEFSTATSLDFPTEIKETGTLLKIKKAA